MNKETNYTLSDNIRNFLLTQFSPTIATRALLEESGRLADCCKQFDDLSLSPIVAEIALSNKEFANFFFNNKFKIYTPFNKRKKQINDILFSLGCALGDLKDNLPKAYEAVEQKFFTDEMENYSEYQVRKGIGYMSVRLWGYSESIDNIKHYVSSTQFDRFFDSGDVKFHNSKLLLKNLINLSSP